ncbi:lytic murein transglycosylase [Tropicimonas sp. IMCC34011]|uniref:lytic murein transglycosylase n=1 Tax=Tropicimonas sp. IMCC34011 TaxID=2248759 RepID=UPI000E289D31|nr:lytic murein transglycosylase [Tropicimonas sp. IMCC34011]
MRYIALAALLAAPLPALAQESCGGGFPAFVEGLKAEALGRGVSPDTVEAFFNGTRHDPAVIAADNKQGVFAVPFVDFARRLISENRMSRGMANRSEYSATLSEAEARFGVPPGILLAFWGFETDFGAVQGDFNTRNALVTLAHDCRRPELFRPQVFAALDLYAQGDFETGTTGAWAGEIGQVQMLPGDILRNGVDGDGDGHVDLKGSAADALMSGAKALADRGWRAGEPWLQEVQVPEGIDWSKTGLDHALPEQEWQAMGISARGGTLSNPELSAHLIAPQGRGGPTFLAYPNFSVLFEWNESFVYVATAAYFATRLSGAPVFDAGSPAPGLNQTQMTQLQQKLQAKGYDVGGVDGILGEMTRRAVRAEQVRLGKPADAWPTPDLLSAM